LSFLEVLLNRHEIAWALVETGVAFVVFLIIQILFVESGAWGFVPVGKQTTAERLEAKS
jgi:hypothetical protein